jgi:hypothetical protein
VGEWVAGSESGQRHCSGDGLVEPARVSQGANEPVVRFSVRRIGGDGGAKGLSRFSRRAGCEQVESMLEERLGERFGSVRIGCGHGCL